MKYYRFLLPGEIIQRGDEFVHLHNAYWDAVPYLKLGTEVPSGLYGYYRRQVTENYLIEVKP